MFFSGIGDEAGQDIGSQVRAHLELGWSHIELRMVDGVNITGVSGSVFDGVVDVLAEAGLGVSCFGSAIANWSRHITCDVSIDRDDLRGAIPRMKRLGCGLIRVMSYPNCELEPWSDREWRRESISRMKYLASMAEDGGVTLVHENCSGWGGMSAENSNILLGEVDSPALKVVFDTGNPVTYGQDAWGYYLAVRDAIAYVHVKDARRVDGVDEYVFCGEGDGCVREIIGDLMKGGYEGGVSIEPHLGAVIHRGESTDDASALYGSYVEYGRRLMALAEEVGA